MVQLPRRSVALVATSIITFATTIVGGGTVAAAPPPNDDASGATALSFPDVITQDTTEATTSADEAALNDFCGAPTLEHGVWFTATAAESGLRAIDVTQSDYSAGILVAEGTPGALVPLLCGPGVVSGFVEAGTTYYILVFGDGLTPETSGTLVVETLTPPPPPEIELTVDPVASVDRSGLARLTGTVTCTSDDPDALLFSVEGELSQRVGRFTIRGYFYTELFAPCDGQTLAWEGFVAGESGSFAGGRAAAITFAFGCGAFDCGFGYAETTVKLRRNGG